MNDTQKAREEYFSCHVSDQLTWFKSYDTLSADLNHTKSLKSMKKSRQLDADEQ